MPPLTFLFMAVIVVVLVIFVVAAWRAMKAHESIAANTEKAIELLESKQ